jgi:hypothetical protein
MNEGLFMLQAFAPAILIMMTLAFAAVFALALGSNRKRTNDFVAAFADDPNFAADPGNGTRPLSLATKGTTPAGHVVASPLAWEVYSDSPRTAERTTLMITLEGLTGGLRDKSGVHDVHTGDAAFDDRYCLRGSDEGIVRGLLQTPAVRTAVEVLFGLGRVHSFTVDKNGVACTTAPRNDLSPVYARDVLRCTLALVAALEEHANVPPAPAPSKTAALTEGAGGGSGSGAPVAVPVSVDDRRRR